MAVPMPSTRDRGVTTAASTQTASSPAYEAFQILHFGFTILPIAAGLDKFFQFLVNWEQYLAPFFVRMMPASQFMLIIGAIEIVAGFIVAIKPKIGAYLVGLWLMGIMANLMMIPRILDPASRTWGLDIVLRNFGLMLGAFALARLATQFENAKRIHIASA